MDWAERSEPRRGGAPPCLHQRLGGCSARRQPSPPAGLPRVQEASFNPQSPLHPPQAPPRGRPSARGHPEGAGAADMKGTGPRGRPPARAASIWPLRPALTREVAPGPRRRRPFVSGAAWRRASRASPCACRRRRPHEGGYCPARWVRGPAPARPGPTPTQAPLSPPSHLSLSSPAYLIICAPGEWGRGGAHQGAQLGTLGELPPTLQPLIGLEKNLCSYLGEKNKTIFKRP